MDPRTHDLLVQHLLVHPLVRLLQLIWDSGLSQWPLQAELHVLQSHFQELIHLGKVQACPHLALWQLSSPHHQQSPQEGLSEELQVLFLHRQDQVQSQSLLVVEEGPLRLF